MAAGASLSVVSLRRGHDRSERSTCDADSQDQLDEVVSVHRLPPFLAGYKVCHVSSRFQMSRGARYSLKPRPAGIPVAHVRRRGARHSGIRPGRTLSSRAWPRGMLSS